MIPLNNVFPTLLSILFFLLFAVSISAQNKIEGIYNSKSHTFEPTDKSYKTDNFREGYFSYSKNGLYGFIDTTGKIICAAKYDEVDVFLDGVARVRKFDDGKNLFGFIDKIH